MATKKTEPEAREWMPISTAPIRKASAVTSQKLLLFVRGRGVVIGWYSHDTHHKNPKPFWDYAGSWGRLEARANQPTHWMPLPKAPKVTKVR